MADKRFELIGTSETLKKEPRTATPNRGEKPQVEAVGTKLPLSMEPTNVKYGARASSGEFQTVGTKMKTSEKPTLGWQSYDTPMSKRAVDSKKNY